MKKQLIVLSAAAMIAAAAVPALAIENEFHGMYRLRGMMTNFQVAGNPTLLKDVDPTYTVFEQRARIQYIAKASDDLKLVTHFEVDSSWGDAAYDNGRGKGAGIAGDTVNLETKNVYIDFKLPSTPLSVKLGLQGFADAYKGTILFDDVAGAVATGKFGAATATAAFLRTYDAGGTSTIGKKNVDAYVLDGKLALSKELTVGGSYYLLNNDVNYSGQTVHMLGVNAAAKLGAVDVDGFLIYQAGDELYAATGKDLSAFAAQIAAKVNLGAAGSFRAAGLYASGDDGKDANKSTAYQSIQDAGAIPVQPVPTTTTPAAAAVAAAPVPNGPVSAGSYYSSSMFLLMRSIVAMDSDQALVASLNNGNKGLMAAFLGYDAKINDKLSASVNLGYAMVSEKAATDKGDVVGTEVNVAVTYALYPNLSATLQGAYAMLGDYYDGKATGGKDPKDPFLTGLMMNYSF